MNNGYMVIEFDHEMAPSATYGPFTTSQEAHEWGAAQYMSKRFTTAWTLVQIRPM